MKKVFLFLVIVFLLTNITFSKGFFQKLKDIKTIGYEIKATKEIINDNLFQDKKIFHLNLKHTKKKRNQLILSLLPFFKEKQALEIIEEINYSDDIWFYKETVDTLIEYSFNLSNRSEIYEKLLALKNKIKNTNDDRSLNIKDHNDDIAISVNYYNARDYENAIPAINRTIPQLYAQINDPNNPPYATMYLKMYVKSFYFMLGGSYTYIIPPGTAEEYKYVEAREAFHKSMTEYAELLEIMKMNSYGLILRTYVYEKDIPNAEKYYQLTLETNDSLNIDVAPEDEQLGEVEILILKKNYDKALEIVNHYISVANPVSETPKVNLIIAYYNRAVIYAEKAEFDKIESDLQKCLEYINEPFDPPNDNMAIVQDEVEYYERLIEKFVIIQFVDNDMKKVDVRTPENINKGKNAGIIPGTENKKRLSICFKTSENQNYLEILHPMNSISRIKLTKCIETENNVYKNEQEKMTIKVNYEQNPSIYAIKKLKLGDEINFDIDSPFINTNQDLRIVSDSPEIICSNMKHAKDEYPDIEFENNENSEFKIKIRTFGFNESKNSKLTKILIRSQFNYSDASFVTIDYKEIELEEIEPGLYISKKKIKCYLEIPEEYSSEIIPIKIEFIENAYTSINAFVLNDDGTTKNEVYIKILKLAFVLNGLRPDTNVYYNTDYDPGPAAEKIKKYLDNSGYNPTILHNLNYENVLNKIRSCDIIYIQSHSGIKYNSYDHTYSFDIEVEKYDYIGWLAWEWFRVNLCSSDELFNMSPHFTFINGCSTAPVDLSQNLTTYANNPKYFDSKNRHDACKKYIADKFLQKKGSAYFGWKKPTIWNPNNPKPENGTWKPTVPLPYVYLSDYYLEGVNTEEAVKFSENFFRFCEDGKSFFQAKEKALELVGKHFKGNIKSLIYLEGNTSGFLRADKRKD